MNDVRISKQLAMTSQSLAVIINTTTGDKL